MDNADDLQYMRGQWLDLMRSYEVGEVEATPLFDDLVAHYSGPDRFYHNLHHVRHVLSVIDELSAHAHNLPAIKVAAWYHDVIYDTHARDNEAQSAEYAATVLGALNFQVATIQRVSVMILATIHDTAAPGDIDCQILLDADLASLGSEREAFDRDGESIRREFEWVPVDQYRETRIRIMEHFLKRERIYLTEPMYAKLEQRARENIRHQVESLKSGATF